MSYVGLLLTELGETGAGCYLRCCVHVIIKEIVVVVPPAARLKT
jgi:hypothetical protein